MWTVFDVCLPCRVMDRQHSLLEQPTNSLYDELRVSRVKSNLESELSREPTVLEIAKKVTIFVDGRYTTSSDTCVRLFPAWRLLVSALFSHRPSFARISCNYD